MKVAVLHHWFVTRGGGERVAECIAALFPHAEIFTLVSAPGGIPKTLAARTLHNSFLQSVPLARSHHRHFLPFYPAATERLDLRGFDLVLSSDSGPVKGARLDSGAVHICYCHSPMRYLWDGYESYRADMGWPTRQAFTLAAPRVRAWDYAAAQRVTHFIANSHYVADRIARCYGRSAEVIHPPIDLDRAPLQGSALAASIQPGEHYLCAGRLVGYKRTELFIEACLRTGRRLRIMGTGPEEPRLRRLAAGHRSNPKLPLVEFLGELPTTAWWQQYASCRALLFGADEDFGMVPLEAQACGRPVIAYGAGGSLETVHSGSGVALEDATGAFFAEQTADSAAAAIAQWEAAGERSFQPENARRWAANFDTPIFLERYRRFVLDHVPAAESASVSASEAAKVVAA